MTPGAPPPGDLSPKEKRAQLMALLQQKANQRQTFPLSFAQQRLWFLHQLEPDSAAYNMPRIIRLRGALNIAALQNALVAMTDRHETLRTTFSSLDEEAVQRVAPKLAVDLLIVDLQVLPSAAQHDEVQRLSRQEARQPFNLAAGPLLRAHLLRLADQDHVLLLTLHHIVSDGWSMRLLFRELETFYRAEITSIPPDLPPLAIQYADFAQWQHDHLQGETLDEHLAYWQDQLGDASEILEFPLDHPRPPVQTDRGDIESHTLTAKLSQALKAMSRQEGVTLFMLLLAGFKALLYRYTGQKAIRVGTVIANRTRPEIEPLIGFFANTLALQTDVSDNPTFRDFLQRVRQTALGAYAHQDLPFEKLVEALQPERDLSRNPLVQIFFGLNNLPPSKPIYPA